MKVSFIPLLSLFLMAGTCSSEKAPDKLSFDRERALRDLKVLSQEPHPMGSPRIAELSAYLEKQMQTEGLTTGRDSWTEQVPDPELIGQQANPMRTTTLSIPMQNVYAKAKTGSESCVYLVGSHYDSKRLAEGNGIGANDSGSSSATLLELMRGIKNFKLRCNVVAIWFDGEEAYLREWRDGELHHPARIVDNTYGSRRMAASLKACATHFCLAETWGGERVEGMLLLDMVGMPDLRLTPETNSTQALRDIALGVDKEMFGGKLFGRSSAKPVEDDHIAFLEKGIPALDLIGFEDLETWHQPSDTIETISIESMEQAAQLTAEILRRVIPR